MCAFTSTLAQNIFSQIGGEGDRDLTNPSSIALIPVEDVSCGSWVLWKWSHTSHMTSGPRNERISCAPSCPIPLPFPCYLRDIHCEPMDPINPTIPGEDVSCGSSVLWMLSHTSHMTSGRRNERISCEPSCPIPSPEPSHKLEGRERGT